MAKDQDKANPEKEAPKRPLATVKVVELEKDVEFTEPEGWILKEIHSVDVESGKFFGVLVKVLEDPNKNRPVRMGKEYEIPTE